MRKNCRLSLAKILIGTAGLVSTPTQAGADASESNGSSAGFAYGGDCTQLSRLNQREILAVTHVVHFNEFDRFCLAQGVYSCSDYSALLGGAGTLETNDSFGCNFIPATL